ncbi:MAG: oxidoreductase [Bacillota bacterium]
MSKKYVMLADLDKCIGCYACEVGCRQWHNDQEEQKRIRVRSIGPQKVNGRVVLEFVPEFTAFCDLCAANREEPLPFCVANCPVNALLYCDEAAALSHLHSGQRCQIRKLG